jgi:hypothetical protein
VDLLQGLERGVDVLAFERRLLGGPGDFASRLEAPDDVGVLSLFRDWVLEVEPALGEHLLDEADEFRQRLVGRVGSLLLQIGPACFPLVQIEPWLTQRWSPFGDGR